MSSTFKVTGTVVQGHGVASGAATDAGFPKGTIEMQLPAFKERGLSLEGYFLGTLNLDISPYTWAPKSPWKKFEQVDWWPQGYPPENFSFFRCSIEHDGSAVEGLVYFPDPETKISEFQPPGVLEILAPWIEGVQPGVTLTIELYCAEAELLSPGA